MPDIATTDNQLLATAISQAVGALDIAVQHKWLDDATARQWLYKFAEERPPATIADVPNP